MRKAPAQAPPSTRIRNPNKGPRSSPFVVVLPIKARAAVCDGVGLAPMCLTVGMGVTVSAATTEIGVAVGAGVGVGVGFAAAGLAVALAAAFFVGVGVGAWVQEMATEPPIVDTASPSP